MAEAPASLSALHFHQENRLIWQMELLYPDGFYTISTFNIQISLVSIDLMLMFYKIY